METFVYGLSDAFIAFFLCPRSKAVACCHSRFGDLLHDHVVALHERENLLTCNKCDFSTSRKRTLEKHIANIYTNNGRDKKCPQCDNATSHNDHLAKHIRAIHLKIRDHKCNTCSYATSSRSKLCIHITAVLNKIRDNLCPFCEYKTSLKTSLTTHINSVHGKLKR
jgi:KRAB domain-containing zinc finger protein